MTIDLELYRPGRHSQNGVALAVALILLVVITLLGLSGVRMSTLELRMSGNDQLRVDSFEGAQSLIDASIVSFSNTPVMSFSAAPNCAAINAAINCNNTNVVIPSSTTPPYPPSGANVIVERVPPASAGPPPGSGYSSDKFMSANMQVTGIYDQRSINGGYAQISEGVAIVFPSSNEIYFSQ